ncbi:MAG: hypothetical protein QOJ07_3514 [Thermoleophilaceae bacterium]|nr:hypothetical protein [Thermoleophilaceae bacterium]
MFTRVTPASSPPQEVAPLLRSFPRLALALIALFTALPAAAHAATIAGDPLQITSSDTEGRLGVSFKGANVNEFCCASVDQNGLPTPGNAGFTVTVLDPNGGYSLYGVRGGLLEPTSPGTVTGTGTSADPFVLKTVWQGNDTSGAPLIEVAQDLTYVNGSNDIGATLGVRNISAGPLQIRASMGADLTGGGSDSGTGVFSAGPPRLVAGLNGSVGALAGLAEATPWTHYEEGQYGNVLSRASGDPRNGDNLQDTVDPTTVDNGVAVQWDDHATAALAPGQVGSYSVNWHFVRTFDLSPATVSATTGVPVDLATHVGGLDGNVQSGVHVRYTIAGSNNLTGDVTTDSNGNATIEYVPAEPGGDTLTAYADLNGNGTQDSDEPQRQSLISIDGPPPPVAGQTVNLAPTEGTVKVKLPKGFQGKVKGKWAHAAATGFTKLDGARQVPVGSTLDVSRGRVQLASAVSGTATSQNIQSSAFSPCQSNSLVTSTGCQNKLTGKTTRFPSGDSNSFIMNQGKNAHGLTEMVMTGSITCPKGKNKVTSAARHRSRSLWGNGHGRFRTRGRNSSATVRGTEWFQKDTCTGTETKVQRGTVIVRDFAKGKNVTVKQGKRYIARPKKK